MGAQAVASHPLRAAAAPAAMAPRASPTAQAAQRPEASAPGALSLALAQSAASPARQRRALQAEAEASLAWEASAARVATRAAQMAASARAVSAAAAAAASEPTRPAWIAWNTPPRMRLGDSAQVEVRLRLGELAAAPSGLQGRITASGRTQVEAAELGQEVDVWIDTTAFGLSPVGVQRQRLSAQRDAVLRWTIQPREAGSHVLLLRVVPVLPAGSPNPAPWVQPFAATIVVEVGALGSVLGFVGANWQPLLSLVVLPVLLWWRKRHQAKN